ncbi:MAG: asparagine synthase-related protein, partial [Flavobacteriaceae bacterium]
FKNNNLLFSSNLKSLANMHKDISIDESSVDEYISYGYITSPKTIFKDIYKVKPAEIIEFDLDRQLKIKSKKIYWEIKSFVNDSNFQKDIFYEKFNKAVGLRKDADVEVGYEDNKYDEKHWSQIVSNKYSTNHIEEIITNNEFEKYIDESIQFLDEPYADPSTVPSYVISKKISNHYKVALTGDGGDELLCGYNRIQQILSEKKFNANTVESIYNLYPWRFGTGNNIRKRSKNLNLNYQLNFADEKFLYKLNENAIPDNKFFENKFGNIKDFMLVDFKLYLSEMMMYKVDRMSMANSLEARSPFVDHNLIEYCLGTNLNFLINSPKSILKDYLRDDFDNSFLNRKKMGFVFNLEKWVIHYSTITQKS